MRGSAGMKAATFEAEFMNSLSVALNSSSRRSLMPEGQLRHLHHRRWHCWDWCLRSALVMAGIDAVVQRGASG